MAVETGPVAWLLEKPDGTRHLYNYERNVRAYAESLGGIVRPLYASPQPEGVITDEMVERAHAAYAKTVGGVLDGHPMRNALTAALLPTHKPLQEEG